MVQRISIHTNFIRLDQFLKLAELASGGGEAKLLVLDGVVKVNGETEIRRGRKLYTGDRVELQGEVFLLQHTQQ